MFQKRIVNELFGNSIYWEIKLNKTLIWVASSLCYRRSKDDQEMLRATLIFSFGYPRKDTCSSCDSFKAQISALEEKFKSDLAINLEETRKNLLVKLKERDVYQKRGECFYKLKKGYRKRSMKSSTMEANAMEKIYHAPISPLMMCNADAN
ncbi:unnamed protein product [Psylliodes chrysocephalus]|uniref:Uncharacterized protein n=1 Tax=Psylliodes chrysocephalus TaxID=3402493 RepID=A0A9P0DB69_9CUCU|nr:unnamed protein product [Psylliodes chrysocephala]